MEPYAGYLPQEHKHMNNTRAAMQFQPETFDRELLGDIEHSDITNTRYHSTI